MTFDSLITNIKWRFSKIFFSKEKCSWNNVKAQNKRFKKGEIISLDEYSTDIVIKQLNNKRIVCIYDGKIKSGGLADRLRGIISVYEICKEQNLDFKIVFTNPFKLSNFLVPNETDWKIKERELNYNTKVTDLCYIDTLTGSKSEGKSRNSGSGENLKRDIKNFT